MIKSSTFGGDKGAVAQYIQTDNGLMGDCDELKLCRLMHALLEHNQRYLVHRLCPQGLIT